MEPALKELLGETIQHATLTGRDAYGAPIYSGNIAHPARIERRMKTVISATGPQLIPETRVYVDADFDISENDRVTLPDGSMPPIQGIVAEVDEQGQIDHRLLYF